MLGRGLTVRRADELDKMRRAGKVVAEMHAVCRELLAPGVTTAMLNDAAQEVIARRGATSNFLGYHGFPAVICASPNDVVVHGIPNDTVLLDGDIVSIDCGAIIDGYHGDAAFTAGVGSIDAGAQAVIDAAEAALAAGIAAMQVGRRLSDIGASIEATTDAAGLEVVRDYVGHGIGTEMHEPPEVPNYGKAGRGPKLVAGAVLAVEPMVVARSAETSVDDDGWTVRTIDGGWAAHAEHSIALTDNGPEILTIA
jgi:methionyl aminopeptidase